MIKALVFDFDGVIIDSESPELQVWQEVFAEHGRELGLDLWADLVGRPRTHFDLYSYFQQNINPAVDIAALRQERRARVIALTEAQPVLPGVHDYLTRASDLGMKIGLASSSSAGHVRGHLARLDLLRYFHTTKCFEDTETHKPEPGPYRAVLDELGVAPEEAVAFEDSPNGVTAARAAGIFCVAVPNPVTCRLPLDHADHRLESLADEPLESVLSRAVAARQK
ncbi:MAG: HAD family hydrolase [Deltaproteobacteria bacterium]|nr:HAD family hydrolase [Deltaproteobacteria bacterium]